MARPTGFGDLQTPSDLVAKLRHDRARMNDDPNDAYAAFDFFVTAEHVLDWLFPDAPGTRQKAKRESERNSEPLLQVVSHIASGAKHFEATASHHKSVADLSQETGAFDPRAFSPRAFSPRAFSMPGLHVRLTDGSLVHVYTLADDVLAYWENRLDG